jgi:hypothetical protein
LRFVGERGERPPAAKNLFENLLARARGEFACGKYREGSKNSKNLQKTLINDPFLKVIERSPEENFFQEVFLWRSPVLPAKPQFTRLRNDIPKGAPS